MSERVSYHLNGEEVTADVPSKWSLVRHLRDDRRLTGAKIGCTPGDGDCGTCTVLVDGRPQRACLMEMAQVEGKRVETVEGLARNGTLHPVQGAFVRTGAGGRKVIMDGGAIIVPFVHELVRVSLETLKLRVTRQNEDALITQDKLRADIHAEFFVRVQPDRESILQASRSLGERMREESAVRALVEDKLVSALRTAAAMKTLEQLNSERDEFLTEVMKLVENDLLSNGLILETVTISRLDQTDEVYLKESNIFDAQGRQRLAFSLIPPDASPTVGGVCMPGRNFSIA